MIDTQSTRTISDRKHHCGRADSSKIDTGSDTRQFLSPQAPISSRHLISQCVLVERCAGRRLSTLDIDYTVFGLAWKRSIRFASLYEHVFLRTLEISRNFY